MRIVLLATALLVVYAAVSIGCACRWRARYPGFLQYLRTSGTLLVPFNGLLDLATRRFARKPVLDAGCLSGLSLIRERWAHIRDEAVALHLAGGFDATTKRRSVGYYDAAFRTFAATDWKTFYLKWHGSPYRSARRLCPETVRILERVPGIRAAMFSILPAGAESRPHADPLACSLRYHLGLETPNSDRCFISVDGIRLSWRNGEDFVVDEAYPHYAKNATDEFRLILLCDVDRPMNPLGRAIARLYSTMARAMAVPNAPEDRRGFFGGMVSIAARDRGDARRRKARRDRTSTLLKLAVGSALVTLAAVLLVVALLGSMKPARLQRSEAMQALSAHGEWRTATHTTRVTTGEDR
jgi:beta-hydroxylase